MTSQRIACMVLAWAAATGGAGVAMAGQDAGNASPKAAPIYCPDCHTCDAPSADSPCLKPCPYTKPEGGTDSLSSKPVPAVISLGLLSDLYEPVAFNHQRHAEMSAMRSGCIACHHYSPKGETPPCQACHGGAANPGNLRQPGLRGAYHRQCLGCHREWAHDTACGECHAERRPGASAQVFRNGTDIVGLTHPKVYPQTTYIHVGADGSVATFHHVDHVDVFGLKCSDCHEKESCSGCHNVSEHPARRRTEPHEDCARCHRKDIDNDCALCHGQTPRERFDHARRAGFDLAVYHGSVRCAQCHGNGGEFSGLESRCSACHEPDWQPASFDHSRTGTALDDLHKDIACADCHAEGVGGPATCAGCHEKAPHPFKAANRNGATGAGGPSNQQEPAGKP